MSISRINFNETWRAEKQLRISSYVLSLCIQLEWGLQNKISDRKWLPNFEYALKSSVSNIFGWAIESSSRIWWLVKFDYKILKSKNTLTKFIWEQQIFTIETKFKKNWVWLYRQSNVLKFGVLNLRSILDPSSLLKFKWGQNFINKKNRLT